MKSTVVLDAGLQGCWLPAPSARCYPAASLCLPSFPLAMAIDHLPHLKHTAWHPTEEPVPPQVEGFRESLEKVMYSASLLVLAQFRLPQKEVGKRPPWMLQSTGTVAPIFMCAKQGPWHLDDL